MEFLLMGFLYVRFCCITVRLTDHTKQDAVSEQSVVHHVATLEPADVSGLSTALGTTPPLASYSVSFVIRIV